MTHASVTLKGTYLGIDSKPDRGYVYIRATADPILDTGEEVFSGVRKIKLDLAGKFSVSLPATDDPALTPTGFGYQLWTVLEDGGNSPYVFFTLPSTPAVVDVTSIIPVSPGSIVPGVDYATQAELDAAIAGITNVPGVAASKHGAVGDGVNDDTAALNAAAAAVAAYGSGFVILDKPGGVYRITGQVNLPNGVGLKGLGSVGPGLWVTKPGSLIKIDSLVACVVFGLPNLDTGGGGTCYSPGAFDFDIDANSLGDLPGVLRFDAVNGMHAEKIMVNNARGTGIAVRCGQNSEFIGVYSQNSGRGGASGWDWNLSGGTGGNVFTRCGGGGSPYSFLRLGKDAGIFDVYSNGPTHNLFLGCIFETGSPITHQSAVRLEDGGPNRFDKCLIVGTNPTSGGAVHVATGHWADFDSCHFVCTGNAFKVSSRDAVINVSGLSMIQLSGTYAMFATSVDPNVVFEQESAIYLGSSVLADLTGGGSLARSSKDTFTGMWFQIAAGEAGNPVPFLIKNHGDTQAKWFIDQNGAMGWGPGGSTFADVTIGRDANFGLSVGGGLKQTGRRALTPSGITNASGGAATYTFDTKAAPVHRISFAAGGSPTFALSNPQHGTKVTLQIGVGTTALTSVTWPSNVWFRLGQPPLLAPNTLTSITLYYDADYAAWLEIGASTSVAAAVQPAPITWTAPTLGTGTNFGSGYTTAGHTRWPDGTVEIRGLLQTVTVGTTIWTLPAGYRPPAIKRFAVWCYTGAASAIGAVDIGADGTIKLALGSGNMVSLDGIRFAAAA